jgi:hypothetical protein
LQLSGSFDFLEKEEIHLQLAGILLDKDSGLPVSGAAITANIYDPEGRDLLSVVMIEEILGSGIYTYTHPTTMKDEKLQKGIYLVTAHAISSEGIEAFDMLQFHIDPPGGQGPDMLILLPLGGFIGLLVIDSLIAGRYMWKRRRLGSEGNGLA